MKLILNADKMKFTVHWYVDGSHQVHEDCRGQNWMLTDNGEGSSNNLIKCNEMQYTKLY
jgi:hypothetical protein